MSSIKISTVNNDQVQFTVQVPVGQYLAIGFGKGMKNVNMISFQSYDKSIKQPEVHNWWSVAKNPPAPNDDSLLTFDYDQSNGYTSFVVNRKFDTGNRHSNGSCLQ
eukprot:403373479